MFPTRVAHRSEFLCPVCKGDTLALYDTDWDKVSDIGDLMTDMRFSFKCLHCEIEKYFKEKADRFNWLAFYATKK